MCRSHEWPHENRPCPCAMSLVFSLLGYRQPSCLLPHSPSELHSFMIFFPAHAVYFFFLVILKNLPLSTGSHPSSLLSPFFSPPTLLALQGYKQIHQETTSPGLGSPAVTAFPLSACCGGLPGWGSLLSAGGVFCCLKGGGSKSSLSQNSSFREVVEGSPRGTVDCSQGGQAE